MLLDFVMLVMKSYASFGLHLHFCDALILAECSRNRDECDVSEIGISQKGFLWKIDQGVIITINLCNRDTTFVK